MDTFGNWILVKIKFKTSWNLISKILFQVNYWHKVYFVNKKKTVCRLDTCLLEKIVIWCSHDILDPTFIIFASPRKKKNFYYICYDILWDAYFVENPNTPAYETLFNIIVFSKPNNHFLLFSYVMEGFFRRNL